MDAKKDWLITLQAPVDGVTRTIEGDVTREVAERFHRKWTEQNSSQAPITEAGPPRAFFCGICPVGEDITCPHDETPMQRGWLFTEITGVQIGPRHQAG